MAGRISPGFGGQGAGGGGFALGDRVLDFTTVDSATENFALTKAARVGWYAIEADDILQTVYLDTAAQYGGVVVLVEQAQGQRNVPNATFAFTVGSTALTVTTRQIGSGFSYVAGVWELEAGSGGGGGGGTSGTDQTARTAAAAAQRTADTAQDDVDALERRVDAIPADSSIDTDALADDAATEPKLHPDVRAKLNAERNNDATARRAAAAAQTAADTAQREVDTLETTVAGLDVPDLPDAPANAATAKKYELNVPATSGDATWAEATEPDPPDVPEGIPDAPDNAATAKKYELNVPATSGAATWEEAAAGGGSPTRGTKVLSAAATDNVERAPATPLRVGFYLFSCFGGGGVIYWDGSFFHPGNILIPTASNVGGSPAWVQITGSSDGSMVRMSRSNFATAVTVDMWEI